MFSSTAATSAIFGFFVSVFWFVELHLSLDFHVQIRIVFFHT